METRSATPVRSSESAAPREQIQESRAEGFWRFSERDDSMRSSRDPARVCRFKRLVDRGEVPNQIRPTPAPPITMKGHTTERDTRLRFWPEHAGLCKRTQND
ncbi:hypothetical protein SKAU_G00266390 [Synaphobranchus kaupii]|uniref:Uncharacterized protein n=1 Tax=Synaphobranchus kaupii TaxID=118154 RepID=A0A9Q1EZL8_SYNKA|nr:hypothetical protein SKAU_G00266390 [Synaphobranchus kaupii]